MKREHNPLRDAITSMKLNVWEKIESIRQKPEDIRMRYVFLCLFISMIFVVGIWMLSLQESFRNIGKQTPFQSVEKGREALSKEVKPSFDSLLEKTTPLRPEATPNQDQSDYFNQQFRSNAQNTDIEPSITP